jgi:hypothetical protein
VSWLSRAPIGNIGGSTNEAAISFGIKVGHQRVPLQSEILETSERIGRGATAKVRKTKHIRIYIGYQSTTPAQVWLDGETRLEQHCKEIAIAAIVQGERQHRNEIIGRYERWMKQRAELLERLRKAKEEAERKERERIAKLERERVDRLLGEADALRQAEAIRRYVAEARVANERSPNPMSVAELERWTAWALEQADRIDPVSSGAFKTAHR